MIKHTPGPWGVKYNGEGYPEIHGSEAVDAVTEARHHWIATLLPCPATLYLNQKHRETGQVKEREANARLIAAAPDLLAACEAGLQRLAALEDCTDPLLDPSIARKKNDRGCQESERGMNHESMQT